jgi:tryptophan-rich sensory protein
MNVMPGPGWGPVAVAGGVALGVLAAGGLLTEIGPWYRALRKPSWQPPDWLFAPAWTVIFALATWAAVLGWNHAAGPQDRALLVSSFALNGALNIGWSLFFFKWRRPDWALIEVVPLWLSILLLVVQLHAIVPRAGWLLMPYLCWVTFAAYLNRTIVRLNGSFA